MRKFVFPAVLFFDKNEEQYTIAIFDLEVFAQGESVEVAVATAQEYLDKYLECAFTYDVEVPEATPFNDMIDMYPQNMVVLVESKLNDKNRAI